MKLLFILSRFPYPLEKGDKLRAYQHLLNLYTSGHEVHLIALSDHPVNDSALRKIQPLCKSVQVIRLHFLDILINVIFSFYRKMPVQAGYFYSRKIQNQVNRVIAGLQPELIYCQLIRTAGYVKNHTQLPRVIDYQDAFSKGTFQRAQKAPLWIRPLYNRELTLVRQLEKESYNWFDGHLIISKQDREALAVPAMNFVSIVPNGVDTVFFRPGNAVKTVDITFVGNMNYPPNVDGASFLVEEIMPLVWKKFPNALVQIAGANPSKKVRSLAGKLVEVTGWVEDIRVCYHISKIFVAPMRMGTGLQNKLLEAMAMAIPCVTTPLSFEPLGAKDPGEILVGKDAPELASHIISLLENEALRNSIGKNGLQFVQSRYSMEHSRIQLNEVLSGSITAFHNKSEVKTK